MSTLIRGTIGRTAIVLALSMALPAIATAQQTPAPEAGAPATPPAATPANSPAPTQAASQPTDTPSPMTLLTGSTSCFLPPLAIDPSAVTAFKAAPDDLLKPFPDGGSRMTQDVRGLAGTDINTVPMLIALANKASPGQTAAIGAGLAQAARACVRQRPDISQIIQQMIIQANLGMLTTAFLSSSGDVQTAATGAAAGGAAAGAGAIGGSPGSGDTSGVGGGTPSAGAPGNVQRGTRTSDALGGSSITFNITLNGGSVSPVQ